MFRRGSMRGVTLALVLMAALVGACGGGDGASSGDNDTITQDDSQTGGDATSDDVACVASCDAKVCGDDGCGGVCGTCDAGFACDAGQCVACTADCEGKTCGDDGCGGSCGTCGEGACQLGQCVVDCVPDCAGKVCGDDGCEGTCGACGAGFVCEGGQCVDETCVPDCSGGPCSEDGCGGTCTGCADGEECSLTDVCAVLMTCPEYSDCIDACGGDTTCESECDSRTSFPVWDSYTAIINCIIDNCAGVPSSQFNACMFQECGEQYYGCFSGPENCGWLWGCVTHCSPQPDCFGECLISGTPEAQESVIAVVNCIGATCGNDVEANAPCWNEAVADGGACAADGQTCISTCTPDCEGKQCGDSGCGFDCGPCEAGFICNDAFECEVCNVECAGATCGPSNCPGVSCGECEPAWDCQDGACVELAHCAPEDATVVTCDQIVTGNNGTGTSRFGEYACVDWDESGPELLYSFTAEADESVVIGFTELQAGVDLDIYVLDATCTAESCITVGDNGLTLDVTAGSTYYVAVDGYEGATGTFSLAFDCPSACADPACGERQCGPAPGPLCLGFECGTCPEGQVCTPQGTCIDDPCGAFDAVGCCAGDVVVWCEDMEIQTLDCQTDVDEPTTCGYWAEQGFFACGPDDAPPDGVEPECVLDCDATCVDEGVQCGLLPACPLTDCGACESGFQCVFGECVEIRCDQDGFTAVQESGTDDENVGRYTGLSAAADPFNAFVVELWWNFGAPTEPGSYEVLDQNYSECGLCVLGNLGCAQSGACEKTFLGFSGLFEMTDVPAAAGDAFGGTVSNLQMREVTIDQNASSTPVAGGQIWCIEGFSFMVTTIAP